jgi:hypothetical protein
MKNARKSILLVKAPLQNFTAVNQLRAEIAELPKVCLLKSDIKLCFGG